MKFFTSKIKIALVAMVVSSIYQISHAEYLQPHMGDLVRCTLFGITYHEGGYKDDQYGPTAFFSFENSQECINNDVNNMVKYHLNFKDQSRVRYDNIRSCAFNMTWEGITNATNWVHNVIGESSWVRRSDFIDVFNKEFLYSLLEISCANSRIDHTHNPQWYDH